MNQPSVTACGVMADATDTMRAIVLGEKDEIPSIDVDEAVIYRTSKPSQTLIDEEDTQVVLLEKHQGDKAHHVRGFAQSMTVLTIHDGTTDFFTSMPKSVRKRFPNVQTLRTAMNLVDKSDKVYALVFQPYQSKGTHRYNITNQKLRAGFGKVAVHRLAIQHHTKEDTAAFFKLRGSSSITSTTHGAESAAPSAADVENTSGVVVSDPSSQAQPNLDDVPTDADAADASHDEPLPDHDDKHAQGHEGIQQEREHSSTISKGENDSKPDLYLSLIMYVLLCAA